MGVAPRWNTHHSTSLRSATAPWASHGLRPPFGPHKGEDGAEFFDAPFLPARSRVDGSAWMCRPRQEKAVSLLALILMQQAVGGGDALAGEAIAQASRALRPYPFQKTLCDQAIDNLANAVFSKRQSLTMPCNVRNDILDAAWRTFFSSADSGFISKGTMVLGFKRRLCSGGLADCCRGTDIVGDLIDAFLGFVHRSLCLCGGCFLPCPPFLRPLALP